MKAFALLFVLLSALHAAQVCTPAAQENLAAARAALAKGDTDRAAALATPFAKDPSGCHEAVLLMGEIRLADGQTLAAAQYFSTYTQLEPSDAAGFLALADVWLRRQSYADADQALESALKLQPSSPRALLLKGNLLLHQGRDEEAHATFQKACEAAPADPAACFQLGRYYDTHGHPPEAVAAFRHVTQLDAANASAWDYLALNLEASGDPLDAGVAFRNGLKVNGSPPRDTFLDYNYGRFLVKQNRLAEAKPFLNRAVELAPDTRAVYYERARLFLGLKDLKQAREDAGRALALPDPGHFILDLQVYYLLARIAEQTGDTDASRRFADLARAERVPVQSSGQR